MSVSTRPCTEPPGSMPELRPRLKVWMQAKNGFGFGSRFVAILEAVERTGSIKRAAAELGWSYRHVWSRIKHAEQALSCTLVTCHLGGAAPERSELTPAGRHVVSRFHELRGRLLALASTDPNFLDS